MEQALFEQKQEKSLAEIPEEFRSFVRTHAWEQGHSCGYQEVLNYVEDMVWSLKPAIEKFQKRVSEGPTA